MIIPPLHVVATEEVAARPGFQRLAAELLESGGQSIAVHLRFRGMDGRRLFQIAELLSRIAGRAGGWCVVNGRVDVALTAEAQAVQLGRGALPVREARRILSGRVAVGASVHGLEEAQGRTAEGADYLLLGTVFETPTHPGVSGAGPDLVHRCAGVGAPVVAIGGIDRRNAASVVEAGAAGIAVVRAVWDSDEPLRAAGELADVVGAAAGHGAGGTLGGKGER